jgi:glycosyltransferase involved in cell wall biosynthesis
MRIAQISTLATTVRPGGGGSVEQLVWLLTREFVRLGHDVTVFAAAGSETYGNLVASLPGPYATAGSPADWQLCEWINLCRAVEQSRDFDVLHSHAYLWGVPLQPLAHAPMVHTMHITPDEDHARLWSMAPESCVTAISQYQWSRFPNSTPAAVVHHGVDETQFTFRTEPEDYICYLGRFISGKGVRIAVDVARSLGLRLLVAGPRNDYYSSHIAPLVDGRSVEYVGSVTGVARNQLLGGARALLYPIQEPEPFGLVLVEAMMCGTPVAASDIGAVPEIVDEAVTGYRATSNAQLEEAVLKAMKLNRHLVRERAEARFSARRMAREYAEVYKKLVTGAK